MTHVGHTSLGNNQTQKPQRRTAIRHGHSTGRRVNADLRLQREPEQLRAAPGIDDSLTRWQPVISVKREGSREGAFEKCPLKMMNFKKKPFDSWKDKPQLSRFIFFDSEDAQINRVLLHLTRFPDVWVHFKQWGEMEQDCYWWISAKRKILWFLGKLP